MLRRDETRFSVIRYVPLALACLATILSTFYWPRPSLAVDLSLPPPEP